MAHAIPFFPRSNVLQTKVRSEIDHLDTLIQQRANLLHRNTVRGGKEHQITFLELRLVRMSERQIHITAQAGKHLTDRRTGIGTRSNHLQRYLRVCRQQTQELNPGVTCSANYANFDHRNFH